MDFSYAGFRLMMLRFPPCPLVLAHCLLSCLFSQAEFQSFCSQHDMNRGGEGHQMLCHRRLYPPLPPPPPPLPPPPPPALLSMAPEAPAPLLSSWWTDIIVIGSTGSALTVFLFLTVFIFYKAIKRGIASSRSSQDFLSL
ncbi:proline-rich membrane anchor 1-like isoform X2 [Rhinichthys klamathensis goyatoka]|uniref:proline-rich membrane anchor 1-like isoform X2 n=1 Tax=Rhinichthys klamathensis goyatoka TaxID=3034132 RepID=UPI0024B6036D|nr:proline-rich membrane anchor 1-like isoform X2 [Rhinichthys klamathensis goyatoka]